MKYIITQIIGAIAYSLLAFSYFKKNKKQILFTQILALITFSIHYYLLDGMTGAICNILELLALIIIYLFEKYEWKNKKLLIGGMIPLIAVIAFITYKDIFSIFPIIAVSVTISAFLTSKERIIRGMGIVSSICWLTYAVALHSIVSVIFEVLTLIFVTSAFVRNEKK